MSYEREQENEYGHFLPPDDRQVFQPNGQPHGNGQGAQQAKRRNPKQAKHDQRAQTRGAILNQPPQGEYADRSQPQGPSQAPQGPRNYPGATPGFNERGPQMAPPSGFQHPGNVGNQGLDASALQQILAQMNQAGLGAGQMAGGKGPADPTKRYGGAAVGGNLGNMQGYDHNKWNSGYADSLKYLAGRVLSDYDHSSAGILQAMQDPRWKNDPYLSKATYKGSGDKIHFGGVLSDLTGGVPVNEVDVLQAIDDATGVSQNPWQWLDVDAAAREGGGPTAQVSPFGPSTGIYDQALQGILGGGQQGQAGFDENALLALLEQLLAQSGGQDFSGGGFQGGPQY